MTEGYILFQSFQLSIRQDI